MFTRELEFYLDAVKFDANMIIGALGEEIAKMKRENYNINELRLARIKSLEECAQKVTNALMEQSHKV